MQLQGTPENKPPNHPVGGCNSSPERMPPNGIQQMSPNSSLPNVPTPRFDGNTFLPNSVQSRSHKGGSGITRAVTSPAVIAGSGSVVAVAHDSVGSAVTMAVFTLLSAANEFRNGDAQKPQQFPERRSGIGAFLLDRIRRPGFCVWMQGWTYLATAFQSAFSGQFFKSVAFTIFAIGEAACSRIADLRLIKPDRNPILVEKAMTRLYELLPENLRIVFNDPGAMFPTGNLMLIACTSLTKENFFPTALKSSPGLLFTFSLGASVALVAALRGLSPLWTAKVSKVSGQAAIMGGVGDIFMGVSAALMSRNFGDANGVFVGIATLIWGISNIRFGSIMEPGAIKSLISCLGFRRQRDLGK